MAESLLAGIAKGVLEKIASRTLQEAVAIYGVENQVSELRETLTAIMAVLLDAEEQRAKSRRLQVWLDRLQDVLYDVEDVLDEFDCEALRKQSDVVGRDIDKEKIIEMLMQSVDDKHISVIPIVGIGGLGKTTLVKLVYNDNSVKEQFKLRMKTVKGIIKDAIRQSLSDFDIQQLQMILQETIKDEKYLLVLDDVWSNDRNRWNELRDLLSQGASGSKIIMTTRSSEVAFIMGTHPTHNLKGLSHENSMVLFKKCAFDEKDREPCPKLLEIGNHIIEKSHGVPLFVKTLGYLLYTKREEQYWTHIRDSDSWNLVEATKDILPVLKLSYDHLPSYLKRCFTTFSLFSSDHEYSSSDLACLWVALGLISSIGEKAASEDIAIEYVKEFWKRCLIQEVHEIGSVLTFKPHDLLHSLATFVAQNDCSIVGFDTIEISEGVRHVSFSKTLLEGISNFDSPTFSKKANFRKCNHLRYLNLSCGSFEELPSSICKLKRLRSLNLHKNKRLKMLPNTICELQSLLQLFLDGCSKLGDLPKNMERLINLRHLYVTTRQKSLQENGIQYLENLRILGICECNNLLVLFEGTCRLTRLEELRIVNCGRPISLPFEKLNALELFFLLTLTQENKSNFPLNLRALSIAKFEQVTELLHCLDGACNLEGLHVNDCPSFTIVPEWLPNHIHLQLIQLYKCPNLSFLPQGVQSLTALKELHIGHCGGLSKRCQPTTGEDWPIISHIPRIRLDFRDVQWTED
ncbi:hypothetical protein BT93_L4942 [Corymbia citriodora subsp. variegata]|uniref:Uncharacterized protein n=1 Tax=Corymbia citriodora subsp. variegata TaxID=360336 RepID=A0A8T0CWW8_CORYI|nr:hypothetical protein BT93_L4942 [Corymbia citriodora subsp. variegata]